MSAPSPVLGKPEGDGEGWSGTRTSNQRGSKGTGKHAIAIRRSEIDNEFMDSGRGGVKQMSSFRPSGHGPNGR